jgi:cobalt-zinc-cadmium efflux system membrane fusion protein
VGIDAGSPVGSGPAPFLIENNAQLRLDLQIPERLASHVRPGMAVHVEQDGRSATGRLLSLASTIDPATRALAAKASLPTDTGLIPGKSVMVTLAATDLAAKDIAAGRGAVSACRVRP